MNSWKAVCEKIGILLTDTGYLGYRIPATSDFIRHPASRIGNHDACIPYLKRIFDILIAGIALVLLSPILIPRS